MIVAESFPNVRPMVARPPAARLPAARRRRQLLDVALELFAVNGYHTTSMNDIAEAAGVTKPVLYQHFRSKRELYLELLEDVGGHLRDAIGKATSEAPSPREQVRAGFLAYFTFVSDQRTAFQLLFGGGSRRDEEFADAVRAVEFSIAESIASLIDVEGLAPDRRQLLAHGIVGLAEGTSRHWVATGMAGSPEDLASHVAVLAWAGLRGIRS
jgi:AcrR family transcriptional regulator